MPKYVCVVCGKEFEAKHKTSACPDCKVGTCIICGEKFNRVHPYTQKTCSAKCRGIYRKESGIAKVSYEKAQATVLKKTGSTQFGNIVPTRTKICKRCGREFLPKTNRQVYCGEDYLPCPICGKPVKVSYDAPYEPITCSEECRLEQIRRTTTERYGTSCVFQSEYFKDKNEETCMEKYGVPRYQNTEEFKQKFKSTMTERYGVAVPLQSSDIHRKATQARSSIFTTDGKRVDSTYEKAVYDFCLRNNLKFDTQHQIKYMYEGVEHSTYIDFCIEGIYFEVKGAHLLQGLYDYAPSMVPIEVKLDVYRRNHVIIITDSSMSQLFGKPNSSTSNGLKYPYKCHDPLIGVDIDLFKNPKFPYRTDRPKCFYDVKVDGNMSAHDAFFDETIRWKMILNRIMYTGGFIDAYQVLNALNVTRTCKQPSWFSKSLAIKLIEKYCTSDTIVDPFAGWGGRADACKELHYHYIGIDLNPELVKWHHEVGRDNIQLGDANSFKYEGNCSVFICPPYSDPITGRCFEDYNFEGFDSNAKAKTQCDWLKIVMKNVPNASEYVMVCKIVDPGFEKFIVDTKSNKSHFGVNNEYILCIPSDRVGEVI